MLVVTTLSVVFACASLLGSGYICVHTRVAVWLSVLRCCGRNRDEVVAYRQQEMVQSILFAISSCDVLASACWISTQAQQLSGAPDVPARCLTAGVIGQFSFIAMSLWTAVFACCTCMLLTQRRHPCSSRAVAFGVWGLSALSTAMLCLGHSTSSCDEEGGGAESSSTPWREASMHVQRAAWRACFVVLPVLTILLCLAEYARVVLYYRKLYLLHAAEGSNLGEQLALRELRARGLKLTLKLNKRLLSYLLAYVVCELPGLPDAIRQADFTGSGDANFLDDGYLLAEENSPLVALRVLAQSLQGLANALVFAHHTGRLNHAGDWCRCWQRRGRSTMSTMDGEIQPDVVA